MKEGNTRLTGPSIGRERGYMAKKANSFWSTEKGGALATPEGTAPPPPAAISTLGLLHTPDLRVRISDKCREIIEMIRLRW